MSAARIVLVGTLLTFLAAIPAPVAAREVNRQEIRQMPITQRPSRPGHFYGNAVRRTQQRRGGR
jgi:hypothetical protein